MSWRIAADAREIFVDLVAVAPDGLVAHFIRTLNRKDQLTSGLTEAISLLPQEALSSVQAGEAKLWLTSDYERVSVREKWGSPSAFITTDGFENLLELGSQERTKTFTLHPKKKKHVVSKDFSFGVSERTLADGTIETPLNKKEVDSILSKLELSQIQNIGICFLHSKKNPQNEKEMAQILKDKGLTVFCSHEESGNELERAQKVSTKAFLAAGSIELLGKIQALGFKKEHIFFKNQRPKLQGATPQNTLYVEFLEDRIIIQYDNLVKELEISPLSLIELDAGGLIHVGPSKVDSEPGPVALGKGLQMTAFDIYALKTKLSAIDISRLKLDSAKPQRQLSPLAQNLRIDPETCIDKCLNLFQEILALEIEGLLNQPPSFLVGAGWMAQGFSSALARRLGIRKVLVPQNHQWASCLQLLEIKPEAKLKSTFTGSLNHEFQSPLAEGEIHDF